MKDEEFSEVYEKGVKYHREKLTAAERALTLHHTIDPGFVNQRLVQSVLGDAGTGVIDEMIRDLPPMPDWMRVTRINHIYKNITLKFCEVNGIRTLGEVIHDHKGRMFCPLSLSVRVLRSTIRRMNAW